MGPRSRGPNDDSRLSSFRCPESVRRKLVIRLTNPVLTSLLHLLALLLDELENNRKKTLDTYNFANNFINLRVYH